MKKRILCLMLVFNILATLIVALPTTVYAKTSGTCGTNLTWMLDDNGILTITGTGKMYDYSHINNRFYTSSAPWYSYASDIREVYISEGVTSIGNVAFSGCRNLVKATIPSTVTSIGKEAFAACILTDMTYTDSVQFIGARAFNGCDFTNFTVPYGVTSIEGAVFSGCSQLTSISIPESVISIGFEAFHSCRSLVSINLPNSIESIDEYSFEGCTSLTSIILPNKLKSISSRAFQGCSNLSSVTIPNGLVTIGALAFRSCTNLKSITIPDSVKSIGESAFEMSGIVDITIPSGVKSLTRRVLAFTDIANFNVYGNIQSIQDEAFYGCDKLENVVIGDSVTSIGDAAFCCCDSLTSVTIGNSVTSIGDDAFYHCDSLTSMTIGNSVASIGIGAFYHCDSLTNVTIPNSVTSIGEGAFRDCDSLTSINVNSLNKNYSSKNGVLFNNNKTELICCPEGKNGLYIIPNSVTSIGDAAFAYCSSLTSVTIPNSVTSIGNYAFMNCDNLKNITFPNNVKSIGKRAFYGCRNLKSISMPNFIQTIGDEAFDCNRDLITYYLGNKSQWNQINMGKNNYGFIYGSVIYVLDTPNLGVTDYNVIKSTDNSSEAKLIKAAKIWETAKDSYVNLVINKSENYKSESTGSPNWESKKDVLDNITSGTLDSWYAFGNDSQTVLDGAKNAAKQAIYDWLGEKSIEYLDKKGMSLEDIKPGTDIISFSNRIVKEIANNMCNDSNFERAYGNYIINISTTEFKVSDKGLAVFGTLTCKSKAGKRFSATATIITPLDKMKTIMGDYLIQLRELSANTIETAVKTYVSDLSGLLNMKLPSARIKEALDKSAAQCNQVFIDNGFGDINAIMGITLNAYDYVNKIIELNGTTDTDELLRRADSIVQNASSISYDSVTGTITDQAIKQAYRNLKEKTSKLIEAADAYTSGKEIPKEPSFWESIIDGIINKFQCPVDIYVYDENNELLGYVEGDTVVCNSDSIYIEKNGDVKTVYVASGTQAHYKIVGTDEGYLNYVVEEYNNGNVSGRANFYDIELYDGKEITGNAVTENISDNLTSIALTSDEQTIAVDEYLSVDDNGALLVNTEIVGNGTVLGDGWYARGDSVTLTAVPADGYVFKGWYENGILITYKKNYTFCAQDYTMLTAKFDEYVTPDSFVSIPVLNEFETLYSVAFDSDDNNTYLRIKPLVESEPTSGVAVYLAEYATDNKLNYINKVEGEFDEAGNLNFTLPLPQSENYKILLWEDMQPIISAFQQIY